MDKKSNGSDDVIKTKSMTNRTDKDIGSLQIEVVVEPLYIICIDHGQEATIIFANYSSFIFLRNVAHRRYPAPIAHLEKNSSVAICIMVPKLTSACQTAICRILGCRCRIWLTVCFNP